MSESLEIMINSVPIPLLTILLFFLFLHCLDCAAAGADELKQQTLQIHYQSTILPLSLADETERSLQFITHLANEAQEASSCEIEISLDLKPCNPQSRRMK